jgi:hypothetical protein
MGEVPVKDASFISKPFTSGELLRKVRSVIEASQDN